VHHSNPTQVKMPTPIPDANSTATLLAKTSRSDAAQPQNNLTSNNCDVPSQLAVTNPGLTSEDSSKATAAVPCHQLAATNSGPASKDSSDATAAISSHQPAPAEPGKDGISAPAKKSNKRKSFYPTRTKDERYIFCVILFPLSCSPHQGA
jgi:hypothetical protein